MSLICTECGSTAIEDLAAPWEWKLPTCPFCMNVLYDEVGKPLATDADRGWCHNSHPHATQQSRSYHRSNWIWRDRAAYPDAYLPVGERAEMAANAEPHVDEEGR